MLALVVAFGHAGYSATGGSFILGTINNASTQTMLKAPIPRSTLNITNTSAASGATALGLSVPATRPPMIVTSAVKVANLNADLLDGFDSAAFTRKLVVYFDLVNGAVSAPINIPGANRAVLVMGTTTTEFFRAVGQVSLMSSFNQWMAWSGLDGSGAITSGASSVAGTKIVSLDRTSKVNVEVLTATSIRIRNTATSGAPRAGTLTIIY
jgi:hypothetical protein